MVLVGWMALASAAVVALSAPALAAFAVLAIGLVAVATLFRSLRWGVGVAVVSLFVFALAGVAGPFPPWALGGDDLLVHRIGLGGLESAIVLLDLLAARLAPRLRHALDLLRHPLHFGEELLAVGLLLHPIGRPDQCAIFVALAQQPAQLLCLVVDHPSSLAYTSA